jgi:hypothetical protein
MRFCGVFWCHSIDLKFVQLVHLLFKFRFCVEFFDFRIWAELTL